MLYPLQFFSSSDVEKAYRQYLKLVLNEIESKKKLISVAFNEVKTFFFQNK